LKARNQFYLKTLQNTSSSNHSNKIIKFKSLKYDCIAITAKKVYICTEFNGNVLDPNSGFLYMASMGKF